MYRYTKYIVLIIISLLMTTNALAYRECVGGTETTTYVYGTAGAPEACTPSTCPSPAKTFCVSNNDMNWWSAVNWCRANGGELVSIEELCPGVALQWGANCWTLSGNWSLWTNSRYPDDSETWRFYLPWQKMWTATRDTKLRATCK